MFAALGLWAVARLVTASRGATTRSSGRSEWSTCLAIVVLVIAGVAVARRLQRAAMPPSRGVLIPRSIRPDPPARYRVRTQHDEEPTK